MKVVTEIIDKYVIYNKATKLFVAYIYKGTPGKLGRIYYADAEFGLAIKWTNYAAAESTLAYILSKATGLVSTYIDCKTLRIAKVLSRDYKITVFKPKAGKLPTAKATKPKYKIKVIKKGKSK